MLFDDKRIGFVIAASNILESLLLPTHEQLESASPSFGFDGFDQKIEALKRLAQEEFQDEQQLFGWLDELMEFYRRLLRCPPKGQVERDIFVRALRDLERKISSVDGFGTCML
jgi:hypothetical protein